MADTSSQRKAHRFFSQRLQDLRPFTKKQVSVATGWPIEGTLKTYWSKQFKGFLEQLPNGRFRVTESFRPYLDWRKFRDLVTQVRTVRPAYEPVVFDQVIAYEFYLPLAHEAALKSTLDSLFYEDTILPRIERIGVRTLGHYFKRKVGERQGSYFRRVARFVEATFSGYSIYHVHGRFRAGPLLTQEAAMRLQKRGQRYLVDETTAVCRFVFPSRQADLGRVRLLFRELFINAITAQVSGEDEIWVVESGVENHVHVWRPQQ